MTENLLATEAYSAARSTHPRVSYNDDILPNIVAQHYFTAGEALYALAAKPPVEGYDPLDLLTICILVTRNGFTVIGKSAAASPENFDAEKGRVFAFEDAVKQLWPLMGYELRERLYRDQQLLGDRVVTETAEGMLSYIGTKCINARPLSRGEYLELRGWALPDNEHPEDEGYLVEYTDKADRNVPGFAGYVTWSPKDVFERAYRRV